MPIFVPLLVAAGGAAVSIGIEYATARATGTTPTKGEYATAGLLGAIPGTGYVRPGIKVISTFRKAKNIDKSGKVLTSAPVTIGRKRVRIPIYMNQRGIQADTSTKIAIGIYGSRKPILTIGKTAMLDVGIRAGYDYMFGTPTRVGPAGGNSPSRPNKPRRNSGSTGSGSRQPWRGSEGLHRSGHSGRSRDPSRSTTRRRKSRESKIWCRRLKKYTTPRVCYGE